MPVSVKENIDVAGTASTLGIKARQGQLAAGDAVVVKEVIRPQTGPLARTTADLSLMLRALDSPKHAVLDPSVPPLPIGDPTDVEISGMRIGFFEDDGFFEPAASVRRAVVTAKQFLVDAGAELVPYCPPNAAEVVYLFFAAVSSDGGTTLRRSLAGENVIDPLTLMMKSVRMPASIRTVAARAARLLGEERAARLLDVIGRKSVADFWAIANRRREYQLDEHAAWSKAGIDALICPLHPTPAIPHGMSKDFTVAFGYAARRCDDFPTTPVDS